MPPHFAWIALGLFIPCVGVLDFLLLRHPVLYGIGAGVVLAQLGLLAVWAALANVSYLLRIPSTLLVLLGISYLIEAGEIPSPYNDSPHVRLGIILLAGELIAQIPLHFAAGAGWRVTRSDRDAVRQFSLSQLLLGVAFWAATFAWGWFWFQERESALVHGRFYIHRFVAMVLGGAALGNAVFLERLVWCLLRRPKEQLVPAMRRLVLVISGTSLIAYGFIAPALFVLWLDDSFVHALPLSVPAYLLTLCGGLFLVREAGFRLVRVEAAGASKPPGS